MDEAENSVRTEVAPPEAESQAAPQQTQAAQADDRQERNWREMRQRQQDLERKLKAQEELNQQLLSLQMQAQKPQEPDELEQLSDEEFIPKGKVKKLVERERNQIVKEAVAKLKEEQAQQEQSRFHERLRAKYSDFDEVVNVETMALLEEQDPELAQTIVELKDPYKIGIQTYKFIKSQGIQDKVPGARRTKEVEKKLDQNAKTVQTPQAYDKRPMAQAYVLTDTEKSKLYEEMNRYARLASSVPEASSAF
jgi:hypothetical protein